MQEDDDLTPDEEMSLPAPGTSDSNKTASGDVCNSGGDLSGPNGVVQNGAGEGACIEVKFSWLAFSVDMYGAINYFDVESEPVEICPC